MVTGVVIWSSVERADLNMQAIAYADHAQGFAPATSPSYGDASFGSNLAVIDSVMFHVRVSNVVFTVQAPDIGMADVLINTMLDRLNAQLTSRLTSSVAA